ncbi:MAG: hypothetical protein RID07_20110, partial [Lacipirellulaceae bacterium]
MPTFYQRPLTWLLVGLWALLNLMLLAGVFYEGWVFGGGVVFGQMFLVSKWVVVGKYHWLWRVAMAVLLVPWTAVLIICWQDLKYDLESWGRISGACCLLVLATCFGVALVTSVRRRGYLDPSKKNSWRISIAEVMVLTLIVAIASWMAHKAQFLHLFNHSDGLYWLLGSFVSGTLLAANGGCGIVFYSALLLPFFLTSDSWELLSLACGFV